VPDNALKTGDDMITITNSTEKLLRAAVAIDEKTAKEAGTVGYMPRALVQTTLPHREPKTNDFSRHNGNCTLVMQADPDYGLPFGAIPRLLIAWISTEAVKRKTRSVVLGDGLSEFMRELDMTPTGGNGGTITRLREQMKRLFSCSFSGFDNGDNQQGCRLVDQTPEQTCLWQPKIELGERFFNEVVAHPIPIDMRSLIALKSSPMAMDIYCWLTHRMSYLKDDTVIPWRLLAAQFGTDYRQLRQFRVAFADALKKVLPVYLGVKALPTPQGLLLKPSATHIPRE
jgi:hypothetical protein